jgi:hypothetical protein
MPHFAPTYELGFRVRCYSFFRLLAAALTLTCGLALSGKSTASGGGPPADMVDMLNAHNEKRSEHCVPPLTWSAELAKAAQEYAETCNLGQHGSAGENMADWVTIQNDKPMLPAQSDRYIFENVWYCEIKNYNFDAPQIAGGFKQNCDPPVNGHFTQIVWKGTQQIGCGRATCNINGQPGTHWVCRYWPAGNSGPLAENVPRPCKGANAGVETKLPDTSVIKEQPGGDLFEPRLKYRDTIRKAP